MGLNRQYVGDGYPLCSDLPPQHFLSQGSVYQLIDSPLPELQEDPAEWRSATPLTLDATSPLFAKLSAGGLKVVLDQTLACSGVECAINAIRTVKVGDLYYEYIRTPCVTKPSLATPRQLQDVMVAAMHCARILWWNQPQPLAVEAARHGLNR